MEIWKDIPSYEGFYQVSNIGNVKSMPREKRLPTGANHDNSKFSQKDLNYIEDNKGKLSAKILAKRFNV